MTGATRWALVVLAGLIGSGWISAARANCVADQGDVDVISADGVTVICDANDPNPFTSGIGSGGTNTNLTVQVDDQDAAIDSASVGVNLGDGGVLVNAGAITAVDQAVLGTDLTGGDGVTITNDGTLTSSAGVGIDLALATSVVTNNGAVDAETLGIRVSGSDVDNTGSVMVNGVLGVGIDAGTATTISNSGTVTSAGIGIDLGVDGVLDNSGAIDAEATAIVMTTGTLFTNTGSVTSVGGLAIDAADGADVINAGAVSGGATDAIRLSGGGNQLTLRTGSEVDGRILSVAAAPVDVLILEGTGSQADDIVNFGSMFMRGESWVLSGQVGALAVDIETGVLSINGMLDTREAGLNPGLVQLMGGELRGTGTVIGNVLNSGGTVAAGNPTGTLSVVGDYVQGVDGFLRVASGIGQVGVLDVSGTATLAGTAVISAGSDGIFEFLVADGGVIGEFDDVVVDGRAVVSLISAPNSVSFIRASTTVEDNMVDAALDSVRLTLDGLSSGSESPGGGGPWIKALGHYGDRDEVDGVPGGDYTIGGGVVGADWVFGGGKSRIGGAVGFTTTDVDIDDGSDGEADNVIYGVYYAYRGDTVLANLAVAGGSNEFDHTRSVFVNSQVGQSKASYDGTSVGVRAELGLSHPFRGNLKKSWLFEPMIALDYLVVDMDPYTEQGGAGLRLDADDIESVQTSLLLRARRTSAADYGLTPRMHIGVVYDVAIDDRKWMATDVGSGVSVVLPGDDDDDTALSVGVGTDFSISRRVSGFFDYEGRFSDDVEAHTLIAGIRVDL